MYTLQTRKTDALLNVMAAGAATTTLTGGAFGTPTGQQIITIDYNVAARTADFLCTLAGASVSSMTLLNGPDVEHPAGALVAMNFVDDHYGDLGKIAASDPWTVWVPVFTGFSADPTSVVARYFQLGKMVWFSISMTPGTSNTTAFTLTLPVAAKTVGQLVATGNRVDNGTGSVVGAIYSRAASTTADVYANIGGAGWTGSSTKGITANGFYEAN